MIHTANRIAEFLAEIPLFCHLSPFDLSQLSECLQPQHYRIGQTVLTEGEMPAEVVILYQGQWRLLGRDRLAQQPVALAKLKPGEIVGGMSLLRGVACEGAIASKDSVGLTLSADRFLALLSQNPDLGEAWRQQCSPCELWGILGAELDRRADGTTDLRSLVLKALPAVQIHYGPPLPALDPERLYWVSSSTARLDAQTREMTGKKAASLRCISLPQSLFQLENGRSATPGHPPQSPQKTLTNSVPTRHKYPYHPGKGALNATLACWQMLCEFLEIPYRRDTLRRVIANQLRKTPQLSLEFCAALADLVGVQAQLVQIPAAVVTRLPVPALIPWENSFALLYEASDREIVIAVPEAGIQRYRPAELQAMWGESNPVLLLKARTLAPERQFGLSWFIPALQRYRWVLVEVFIASFFVQLFGLANPLMTQVIIDQVIGGGRQAILPMLAVFLVVTAIFQAVLTTLRTYLFADTTNRIDLSLGAEVIDRLLRLPLAYFNRRPVGELASRVNELENIRQFLTGTALTVVLDAVFSVLYIAVMLLYSPLLTLVALGVIPLFLGLTLIVAPLVRRRLRAKAERNAETQSYLVEVLSGIETVKAQNLELRSRMSWQERYSRYIAAGFKAVQLSAIANSLSTFLNQLSSLLVLCVGAHLVLTQQLTLGELIAFRIISGYVTGPLLRLSQLWQNFQETALSLERLSDILDSPPEDEGQQDYLPMPALEGKIEYENISFRFASSGPLQLNNINLEIPAGQFVGIVGQSGSGKSTLTKLLPRLYDRGAGRLLIDRYDIHKVELYSLRRQIGIVPQNTLLFDGTVRDNIAIASPQASFEEIVAAARTAAAHDFIMDLPAGYSTRVGERGSSLSGGQRQRIAIARTVLQNPQMLILDEATSALDYDTEGQVCQNLMAAFGGRTVLFITHRLSTIRNADRIVMMDRGLVVEQGTHEELMAQQGSYYCLYRQQDASSLPSQA